MQNCTKTLLKDQKKNSITGGGFFKSPHGFLRVGGGFAKNHVGPQGGGGVQMLKIPSTWYINDPYV